MKCVRRFFILILAANLILMIGSTAVNAAKASSEAVQFDLGWQAYESGRYKEALRIWQTLAENGYAQAQINLGALYDSGKGVKEDPVTAAKWYQAAALRGNPYAQYNLGMMYAEGRGVRLDLQMAARLYRKAADQGLADAQYHLGLTLAEMTSKKADTEANLQSAIKWIYKSGVSYLAELDIDRARESFNAIERLAPSHPLGSELFNKIRSCSGKSTSQGSTSLSGSMSVGTAWPITSDYIVTNNHVIAESKEITLLDTSGTEIKAQIVLKDEVSDIAILKADTPNELPPALPLARRHAELGAQVFTIGFPGAEMLSNSPKLTHGRISSLKGLNNDPALYQTTVPIQAGNSGGPLVNMKGEVVGVIRSMLGLINESDGELYLVQNASCALKIENLNMLLARLPAIGRVGTRVPLIHKGKDDVYRQIQDSMLMVIAR
jgi:S1-C subfamily serine protease